MEFCIRFHQARTSTSLIYLTILYSVLCTLTRVEGWSYHYSNTTMDWPTARAWCREHFTDMVAIQNKPEIQHLTTTLPRAQEYYWIGIRKQEGVWTWVGTSKALTAEENWARGEPNNGRNNEDCVEIYIKREKENGMWNDAACSMKKRPLCYTASCDRDSCFHGECVEDINSHRCECFDGFEGEKCEHVVQCKEEEVAVPDKASRECFHPYGKFSYSSTCQYSCEEGYQLSSSGNVTCMSSGVWSQQPPSCELMSCAELYRPVNGSMDCLHPLSSFSYRSTCVFSCDEGYELAASHSTSLQCGASGHWNHSLPQCAVVQCKEEEVAVPDKASRECFHPYGKFSYSSTCQYSCEEGYQLSSSGNVTCMSSGVWSQQPPSCELMSCAELYRPVNGSMDCLHPLSSFSYRSTCVFSCDEGYELAASHSTSLQCGASGLWNHSLPQCAVVQCKEEEVAVPDKASRECFHPYGKFSYSSTCQYSCEEGYQLSSSGNVTCMSSGVWSQQPPSCELMSCAELYRPVNGSMDCLHPLSSFSYRSTCVFSCDEGYELAASHSTSLQCGASGLWNHSLPQCAVVQCKEEEVAVPDKASRECFHPYGKFSYSSTCQYSCEEGYQLSSSGNVTCMSSGVWSQHPPSCELMSCAELYRPVNGSMDCLHPLSSFSYRSTCVFSCDEGYELAASHSTSLQCGASGHWSHSLPQCAVVQCKEEEVAVPDKASRECFHPYGKFSYSSTCQYSCEEGYQLSSSGNVTCMSSGVWSQQPPSCEPVQCPALHAPENGNVTCGPENGNVTCGPDRGTQFSYAHSCRFSCQEGFSLQGAGVVTCTATAAWDEQTPHCEAVRCSLLQAPANGALNCSHLESESDRPVYGSRCSFTCDQGFTLQHAHEGITCDHHGNWTGDVPNCQVDEAVFSRTTMGLAAGGAAVSTSGLLLALLWLMKRLRQKSNKFKLNCSIDTDELPQLYKPNSCDCLI